MEGDYGQKNDLFDPKPATITAILYLGSLSFCFLLFLVLRMKPRCLCVLKKFMRLGKELSNVISNNGLAKGVISIFDIHQLCVL